MLANNRIQADAKEEKRGQTALVIRSRPVTRRRQWSGGEKEKKNPTWSDVKAAMVNLDKKQLLIWVSKAKKAISNYVKAVDDPVGEAELMIYFVECGNRFAVIAIKRLHIQNRQNMAEPDAWPRRLTTGRSQGQCRQQFEIAERVIPQTLGIEEDGHS